MDPRARQQARTELEWLRQRAMQLEMENRDLRRQLDELRRGVGITVLIHGRPVPLSALPPARSARPSMPTSAPLSATGQHLSAQFTLPPAPAWTPPTVAPVPPVPPVPPAPPFPPSQASLPYPPAPHSMPAPPSTLWPAAPGEGPRSQAFPEEDWITGHRHAIRPQPQPQAQAQPAEPQTGWRPAARPSQRLTPGWLRDQPPASAADQANPVSHVGAGQAAPSPRSRTDAHPIARPQSAQRGRPRMAVPRLEPTHIPSLAEITGSIPAVRVPGKGARPERNPFADSYVLD